MIHGWLRLIVAAAALCLTAIGAKAQMPVGPWVADSDQRIDEVRKTSLRVIVLQADGKPAFGAQVHLKQTRSTFHVGYILPASGLSKSVQEAIDGDARLWRCVNAVSLRHMTDWPTLQPALGGSLNYDAAQRIDRVIEEARARGMYVRWGSLISADLGLAPPWVASLSSDALAEAVNGYVALIAERYGSEVDSYDLYTHWLTHDLLGERVGTALIREVYETFPASSPDSNTAVRFEEALDIERMRHVQRKLTEMHEAIIPVDTVAMDQHFTGKLDRLRIERRLSRMDQLDRPVVFSSLSVGGDTELDASINMETLLRSLMERPNVKGVWLAGWTPEQAPEPTGALLDSQGRLMPVGKVVDHLFHELWRTNITTNADELGNVQVRVFPGAYRVRATLSDGTIINTSCEIEKSDEVRVLLLEPRRPVKE